MAKKKKTKDTTVTASDPKVQHVLDKYGESKDYYRELRGKFDDWDNVYFCNPDSSNPRKSWMSNLYVPASHKSIMTLLSRIVNNTTSLDPNFDVVPSSKPVANLIRSQLYRGDFYSQWVLFCLQLLVRGTSVGKISWQKKTKTRFSLEKVEENIAKEIMNEETGQPEKIMERVFKGYKKKPKEVVKYDGPVFETIDLHDFFPEPRAQNLYDGVRIFRSVKTKNDFMKNPNYINKDKVLNTGFPEKEFPHARLQSLGLSEPDFTPSRHLPTPKAEQLSDFVELLECETQWWNPKTERLEPWLIVIANQEVLVRDEPFPYWNTDSLYVKGTWIPILNEWYGMGVPELTESLQEELNDKRNQRIDNINQVLMPIMLYEESAVDPKQMRFFERKPGGKLRTKTGAVAGQQIRWDVCPDVTQSATLECQNIEQNIEEITGAVKAIQPSGAGSDIHRTSSGLMLLQSMAHEKIKLNLSVLEKQVLEPMWEKYYDLNLQFLTPGYKIFDPDGKPVSYEHTMLTGDYEFRAKGSRYALDNQIKNMNIARAIEALAKSGLPISELHVKFFMKYYDSLGFEDKEQVEQMLRKSIAQQQQMQQQMAMAKAAGKGGGGAAGGGADPAQMIRMMTGEGMNVDQTRSNMGSNIPGGNYGV